MKTKKLTALLLSLLTACTLFTACGKAEAAAKPEEEIQIEEKTEVPEAEAPEKEVHADSIVFAVKDEPPTLNPYDHASVVSGYMNQLTFNSLF